MLQFQFELKELKRRKEEDESRRRQEEIEKATPVRHSTEKPDGERAESGSIRSGSEYNTVKFDIKACSRDILFKRDNSIKKLRFK